MSRSDVEGALDETTTEHLKEGNVGPERKAAHLKSAWHHGREGGSEDGVCVSPPTKRTLTAIMAAAPVDTVLSIRMT